MNILKVNKMELMQKLQEKDILPGVVYVSLEEDSVLEHDEFINVMNSVVPKEDWIRIGNCSFGDTLLTVDILTRVNDGVRDSHLVAIHENGVFSYHYLDLTDVLELEDKYDLINDFNAVLAVRDVCFGSYKAEYKDRVQDARHEKIMSLVS